MGGFTKLLIPRSWLLKNFFLMKFIAHYGPVTFISQAWMKLNKWLLYIFIQIILHFLNDTCRRTGYTYLRSCNMFYFYLQDLLYLLVVLSIDDPVHMPLQNSDQVSTTITTSYEHWKMTSSKAHITHNVFLNIILF